MTENPSLEEIYKEHRSLDHLSTLIKDQLLAPHRTAQNSNIIVMETDKMFNLPLKNREHWLYLINMKVEFFDQVLFILKHGCLGH